MKFNLKCALVTAATAAAFSAQAADVSLYGSISTGVVYSHTNAIGGAEKQDNLSMESAWYGDSIWGIEVNEELGNGWKVKAVLENEYASDDGTLAGGDDGKLFDSQAYLSVTNDTVTVAAGRLGTIDSAGGDFDLVGGFDPLEAAFGVGGMGAFATRDVTIDNGIYVGVTPVEGLTFAAMGSFGNTTGDSEAHWNQRDHYYAIGASYENGPFAAALTASTSVANAEYSNGTKTRNKDSYAFTFGVSYDLEAVKPMFMYQHTERNQAFIDYSSPYAFKSDSFLVGATAPISEGTLMASLQYVKVKLSDEDQFANGDSKANALVLGIAYNYELSKRTSVYAGATYAKGSKGLKKDYVSGDDDFDAVRGAFNGYQFGIGLNHAF